MTTGAAAPLSNSEILSSSHDPSSRIFSPSQMMSSATLRGMYPAAGRRLGGRADLVQLRRQVVEP
jgi:hypothetical protein